LSPLSFLLFAFPFAARRESAKKTEKESDDKSSHSKVTLDGLPRGE
jgi:hypothetical protein